MPYWRHNHEAVYAYCQRCGFRQMLSEMRWQNGVLVCYNTNCVDTAIIGSRDIAVSRAVAIDRHELEPDRKLIEPADRKNDQNEILY
jgi:hypothetical protein